MKNTIQWVMIATLAIAVIILAVVLLPGGEDRPPRDRSDQDAPDSVDEQIPEDVQSFDYLLPNDWSYLENAEEDIQSLAPGQRVAFGVLEDPTDDTFAFFASYAFDQDAQENLLSIYRYNQEDYSFERIYRATYGKGDFDQLHEEAIPIFHVLGYDSGRLIILAQDTDDSPGPCAEPVLLGDDAGVGARRIVSMNLEDPYSGFEDYTIPDEVLEEARNRATQCLEDMQ